MATAFPTGLDTFTDPNPTDKLSLPGHSGQHTDKNDSIEAIEAKVGIDGSAVTASHDYKLSNVTGTTKALSGPASPGNWKVLFQNGSGVITELAVGANDTVLKGEGVTSAPTFGIIQTGEIDGGNWKVLYTDGGGDVQELALPATGLHLVGQGVSAAPAWETMPEVSVHYPAFSMVSPSTNGAADGTIEGTNLTYRTKDYDQSTEEHCDFQFRMPDAYTGGTITVIATWTGAGGSGTVAWEINIEAVANDDPIDAAKTDVGSITDTLIVAGDLHEASLSWSSSLPSPGDTIYARISRDVAADNLTSDARLIGITFKIPVRGS